MQVTVIKDGEALTVGVNGEYHAVPFSVKLPASFHALQWDDAHGEIEHRMMTCDHCGSRSKKANEAVSDLTPYQPLLDAWRVAKTAADVAKAEMEAEVERAKAAANATPAG